MAVAMDNSHFYVQLNNCRVCKHVCARVCHGNCRRIRAFLRAGEQLIGFVGMSVTRFALSTVAEGMHFCVQVNNCRVCRHVCYNVARFASSNVAESLHFCIQVNNCSVCRHVCYKVCRVCRHVGSKACIE